MGNSKWYPVLAETQFSVNQTVLGLRELAKAVHRGQLFFPDDDLVVQYRVHSALLSLTTGVERMGKLAIALDGWSEESGFLKVKNLSHHIDSIATRMASLQIQDQQNRGWIFGVHEVSEAQIYLDFMTKYASGQGRYEHLDSLDKGEETIGLYQQWMELVDIAEPEPALNRLVQLPQRIATVFHESQLDEVLYDPYLDNFLPMDLDPKSLSVALDFFRIARWFGTTLSLISARMFRDSAADIPYLPEVIDRYLLHEEEDFVSYYILGLGDLEATVESVEAAEMAADRPRQP